ncbi:hypothetical protein ACN42_g235 [Penicillium freii]|uniref:Uncharacterized protein n=1 Tax=Penicillium freii TaxID=48697 RepID=A0A117NSW7_PENFR|nr:hypothetical protein ACN42_g235 [Penicillium freii]
MPTSFLGRSLYFFPLASNTNLLRTSYYELLGVTGKTAVAGAKSGHFRCHFHRSSYSSCYANQSNIKLPHKLLPNLIQGISI